MTINVSKAFDYPGEYTYEETIPLEELQGLKGVTFTEAVPLKMLVSNKVGVVMMEYTAHSSIRVQCARCLKELELKEEHHFEHVLVRENDTGNDDFITAPGGVLDMSETALTDILLEMPLKFLCREDCKGLCPVCGADLNEGGCGCEMP